MRRFLQRVAVADPKVFRRKASPVRGAAAVAWAITRLNDSVGPHHGLTTGELLEWFGVSGSVSQRAEPMLRALGADPYLWPYIVTPGSPDLMVGEHRQQLIEQRDRWSAE